MRERGNVRTKVLACMHKHTCTPTSTYIHTYMHGHMLKCTHACTHRHNNLATSYMHKKSRSKEILWPSIHSSTNPQTYKILLFTFTSILSNIQSKKCIKYKNHLLKHTITHLTTSHIHHHHHHYYHEHHSSHHNNCHPPFWAALHTVSPSSAIPVHCGGSAAA